MSPTRSWHQISDRGSRSHLSVYQPSATPNRVVALPGSWKRPLVVGGATLLLAGLLIVYWRLRASTDPLNGVQVPRLSPISGKAFDR